MTPGDVPRETLYALVAYWGYLALARIIEVSISARHARRLRRLGAVEFGQGHLPLLFGLHALFPLAVAAEVIWGGARAGPGWGMWLVLLAVAQGLRVAAIRALGVHWNLRILVIPGMSPIRRGPYRWLRHPNYVAVATEFVAGPMLFGAWRTALVFSLLNAMALRVRIRAEERALDWAATERGPGLGSG